MRPRVYLAGPDVFLPDPIARGEAKRAICLRHGLDGVFPLDRLPEAPAAWDALPEWQRIARCNEAHIARSQAVIADLTPFRGPSADPGTVYEIGYARGLGLPVYGYATVAARYTDRVLARLGGPPAGTGPPWRDADGMAIEAFGCHDNLMIDGGLIASGGALITEDRPTAERWTDLTVFERCVAMLAGHLSKTA